MIIRNTNGKGLAKLMTYLKELNKERVYVGVPASKNESHQSAAAKRGRNDGSPNINTATLAMIHEFGLGVPERSFLRATILQQSGKYSKILSESIPSDIANGETSYNAYSKLGLVAQTDIQDYMVKGSFAALAPATIKRKRSSKPLNDTGALRGSIGYEIR